MANIAIITGASKGIGFSAAEQFLNNQWQVINISRTAAPKKNIINLSIDLGDQQWPEKNSQQILEKVADADKICLVHNASRLDKDSIADLDATKLREIHEINLVAPAILNKLLIPKMKSGSSIIYIGSTLSEMAVAGAASYVMSKHAVAGMMRATCQDLVDKFIHTCCICPGFTDTEMLRQHLHNDEAILDQVRQANAERRLIEPHEIAELIWYAANHSVINGSLLHANLGQITS